MTCDKIDIVTPYGSGNFDWLVKIYESIQSIPIEWRWYIVADSNVGDDLDPVTFQDEFKNTYFASLHSSIESGWGKNQINY